MSEKRYPYVVKRWRANAHQAIPIIFTRKCGVRYDGGNFYIGYPEEPFLENGALSERCRQFIIELQSRGKLYPLIVFGPQDSVFIDPHASQPGVKRFHGVMYIPGRAFINGKEIVIVANYKYSDCPASVIIRRTTYGSYLLYIRYKDTGEEEWLQEGSLSDMVDASNEMLGRDDRAYEERPMYRLDRGNLTVDGYPVLKSFGSNSGKRWFVTLCEEIRTVPNPGSDSEDEVYGSNLSYFGVIRDGDSEFWDFWLDEDIDPHIESGEVREYRPEEFGFLDISTFDQIYLDGADPR